MILFTYGLLQLIKFFFLLELHVDSNNHLSPLLKLLFVWTIPSRCRVLVLFSVAGLDVDAWCGYFFLFFSSLLELQTYSFFLIYQWHYLVRVVSEKNKTKSRVSPVGDWPVSFYLSRLSNLHHVTVWITTTSSTYGLLHGLNKLTGTWPTCPA